jgi:hypothetical protein
MSIKKKKHLKLAIKLSYIITTNLILKISVIYNIKKEKLGFLTIIKQTDIKIFRLT